ncbi:MAG: RluA family pseudouridine synthase [Pirellulaceae bacterium]
MPSDQDGELTVGPEQVGTRLDRFLAGVLEEMSRSRISRSIQQGEVTVNGQARKPSYRLAEGDCVEATFSEVITEGPQAENIPLDVLYEDEDMVVVNKAADMVVHPSRGHWSGTLASALCYHFQQLSSVGGPTRPGIVHRLDRDTTGVILVARHDHAHQVLASQFEARTIKKEYLAIVHGRLDHDRDVIRAAIGTHAQHRTRMAVRREGRGVRDAETFYEVVSAHERFSVLRVQPRTGRTHQIRVHLAHVGCAVVCDRLYSHSSQLTRGELSGLPEIVGAAEVVIGRQGLHAASISCRHPVSGKEMNFQAPVPPDMTAAIECLQHASGDS